MSHTTTFRRAGAFIVLGLGHHATFAQVGGAQAMQSLDAIRKTAQTFVQQRVPGEPNTVEVSVGTLDPRLRLAACSEPLQASLPAGVVFKERVTVAVSCAGAQRWTVYVPVQPESSACDVDATGVGAAGADATGATAGGGVSGSGGTIGPASVWCGSTGSGVGARAVGRAGVGGTYAAGGTYGVGGT